MKRKEKIHRRNHTALLLLSSLVFGVLILGSVLLIGKLFPFHARVTMLKTPTGTFAYYTRGTGAPILMLPGSGMTMREWDPLLLEKLSQNNMLILFDYPGVGRSRGDTATWSEEQLAYSIISFMQSLGIKKAHILGWSLGSFVGQIIAEKYSSRVDKLVLIATAPGDRKTIQTAESVSTAIQNNLGGSWETTYVPFMFPADEQSAYLTRLNRAVKNGEAPMDYTETISARKAYEHIFSDETQEQIRYDTLSKVHAPTLIIAGEKDILLPVENDRRVHARIPSSQLRIFSDAGHGVLFQDADAVSSLVTTFLQH